MHDNLYEILAGFAMLLVVLFALGAVFDYRMSHKPNSSRAGAQDIEGKHRRVD